MADNFGTLNPTTLSNSSDAFLVRQNGIDYRQSRDDLAAGLSNARWSSTGNYSQHSPVIGSDGLEYIAQQVSGPDNGGAVNPVEDMDSSHWKLNIREVDPRNADWCGFLDPAHTTRVEFEDTSAGVRSFSSGSQIVPNIFVSGTSDITFTATGWSWLAGNTIYKEYSYTQEQLSNIPETEVPVYLVGDTGSVHIVTSSTTGVNITKPDTTTLRVELTADIFTTLSITSVWEFFVTDFVGRVPKLSPDELEYKTRGFLKVSNVSGVAHLYKDGYIEQFFKGVVSRLTNTDFPVDFGGNVDDIIFNAQHIGTTGTSTDLNISGAAISTSQYQVSMFNQAGGGVANGTIQIYANNGART